MKKIINIVDNIPEMENPLGCKLKFALNPENKWGFGTLYLNGKCLGDSVGCFLEEESNRACYAAPFYEILENNEQIGIIRFYGTDGKINLDIRITLLADQPTYTVEMELDPMHPVYHPVFAKIPFFAEKAEFIKYPYEDSFTSEDKYIYRIETDLGRAPLLFGCEEIDKEKCFVGVGYHLEDDFDQGCFMIDPINHPGAALKVYSQFKSMARAIDLQCITHLELIRVDLEEEKKKSKKHFRYIISTAQTQYDCIKGYIDACGYEKNTKIRNSIDHSVGRLMKLYKTVPGYFQGMGYPALIRTDTGKNDTSIPHGWYSKYIFTGPEVQLGYELYQYWKLNREEKWARERAFTSAEFLCKSQFPNGLFPPVDTDAGATGDMHPEMFQSSMMEGYFFGIDDMMMGAYHLYMLYDDVLKTEGTAPEKWKEAAQLTIKYVMSLVGEDGTLGRNYNAMGKYDKECAAIPQALLAMDYMYRDTLDESINECRQKVEDHLYEKFIRCNNWKDGCMDGGAWQGCGIPPTNNDSVGLLGFICYCAQMHINYGDKRYIQMAKDIFAYQWTLVVPIDIPGYTHGTRGLMREQDFYSAFDIPLKINDYADCLPYLSKVTNDPFFMQYFKIILQTEMDYQETKNEYQGFHIGLQSDYDGKTPIDVVAEGKSVYIIRFASLFLKSVRSPISYQYVGGKDWGVGRDYQLPFTVDKGIRLPYIICSTAMVRNISWYESLRSLRIWGYDTEHKDAHFEIDCHDCAYPIESAVVKLGDHQTIPAKDVYDPSAGIMKVTVTEELPSKVVEIIFAK